MSALDFGDPVALGAWLHAVREQARDIAAAGLDATAPPGARELGRKAARRIVTEAADKLELLFTEADLDAFTSAGGPDHG